MRIVGASLLLIELAFASHAYSANKECDFRAKKDKLVQKNDFTTDRGLGDIITSTMPSFTQDLLALGPNDIYLLGGAGKAHEGMDYLYDDFIKTGYGADGKPRPYSNLALPPKDQRARVVAVSFERPKRNRDPREEHPHRDEADRNPKFIYIECPIQDLAEKHPEYVGAIALITDRHGTLQYYHLQKAMIAYLKLAKVGAKIHFSTPYARIKRNGILVSMVEYFRAIKGTRLEFMPGSYNTQYISEQNGRFVIEKTSDDYFVPTLIETGGYQHNDVGPETFYDWVD